MFRIFSSKKPGGLDATEPNKYVDELSGLQETIYSKSGPYCTTRRKASFFSLNEAVVKF